MLEAPFVRTHLAPFGNAGKESEMTRQGNRKVNEQAREVIASILLFDLSDPRLRMATITGCDVSYDRSVCTVHYTTDPDDYAATEAAFEQAKGRIRSLMAKKLSWRVAPELRFKLDTSVDHAEAISMALNAERDRARQAAVDDAAERGGEL